MLIFNRQIDSRSSPRYPKPGLFFARISCLSCNMHYYPVMEHSPIKRVTPELAQAIVKGERDYAELLHDMALVRDEKVIAAGDQDDNLKHGVAHLERRLRGTF